MVRSNLQIFSMAEDMILRSYLSYTFFCMIYFYYCVQSHLSFNGRTRLLTKALYQSEMRKCAVFIKRHLALEVAQLVSSKKWSKVARCKTFCNQNLPEIIQDIFLPDKYPDMRRHIMHEVRKKRMEFYDYVLEIEDVQHVSLTFY